MFQCLTNLVYTLHKQFVSTPRHYSRDMEMIAKKRDVHNNMRQLSQDRRCGEQLAPFPALEERH